MKRLSGQTRKFRRAHLLATVFAAGSIMGALPVSAADEVNHERLLNVQNEPGTGFTITRTTPVTGSRP